MPFVVLMIWWGTCSVSDHVVRTSVQSDGAYDVMVGLDFATFAMGVPTSNNYFVWAMRRKVQEPDCPCLLDAMVWDEFLPKVEEEYPYRPHH